MIRSAPWEAEPIGWPLHGPNYRADSNRRGGLAPMNCETVCSLRILIPAPGRGTDIGAVETFIGSRGNSIAEIPMEGENWWEGKESESGCPERSLPSALRIILVLGLLALLYDDPSRIWRMILRTLI